MEHMNINIEYGAYFCFMLLMFKFEGHPGLGEILHLEDSRMLSKQPCAKVWFFKGLMYQCYGIHDTTWLLCTGGRPPPGTSAGSARGAAAQTCSLGWEEPSTIIEMATTLLSRYLVSSIFWGSIGWMMRRVLSWTSLETHTPAHVEIHDTEAEHLSYLLIHYLNMVPKILNASSMFVYME